MPSQTAADSTRKRSRSEADGTHEALDNTASPLNRLVTAADGPQETRFRAESDNVAVDAATRRVTKCAAQVVKATLYAEGWERSARSAERPSVDSLRDHLEPHLEDTIPLYSNFRGLSQSPVLTNVVDDAATHINTQWTSAIMANAELKEAERKLDKAKDELEKAKAELEKALAAGPTLEQVINGIKTQSQRFEICATTLVDREAALDEAIGYIEAVVEKKRSAFCDGDSEKLRACATAGIPGIGKTSLLKQIAYRASQKYPAIAATFNGDRSLERILKDKIPEYRNLQDAFANALLQSHFGIDKTRLPFRDAIYAIRVAACHRRNLPSSPPPPLVVCLDELAYLDMESTVSLQLRNDEGTKDNDKGSTVPLSVNLPAVLLCMSNDPANGVIFIFSHIQYTFGEAIQTNSGRSFYKDNLLPLPLVDTEAALDLICTKHEGTELGCRVKLLMEAYKGPKPVRSVVALIDGLGGHPRALFEGLPKALSDASFDSFLNGEDYGLTRARTLISAPLKLTSTPKEVDSIVRMAFHLPPPEQLDKKEQEHFVGSGLLLKINERLVVSPVALLQWASLGQEWEQRYLYSLFYTDSVFAQLGCEKKMESICYNHDAALRAFNVKVGEMSKPFILSQYYVGGTMPPEVGSLKVIMKRPFEKCLWEVERFDGSTVTLLKEGQIVISKLATEPGIEYLVPFHRHDDETKLIVAAVQCKFVGAESNLTWLETYKKICDAAEVIFPNDCVLASETVAAQASGTVPPPPIVVVPVIMSTIPTERVMPQGSVRDNAIVFNLPGLHQFFHRVAALRLLVEKAARKQIQHDH